MRLGLVVALLLVVRPAFADSPQEVVDRLDAAADPAVAGPQALTEIDAYIASAPNDAFGPYARAMILSRLDRKAEAIESYDRAAALDPTLADASYNAGVLFTDLGVVDDAIARYEVAIKADPKHVDALYNLGQIQYLQKRYVKALAAWQAARALTPDDFGVIKKILQTYNALGLVEEADRARAETIAAWKASADPAVRALTEFVFEQFDTAGWHVYAYETFEPTGDEHVVYRFMIADAQDYPQGAITVEASAALRKRGYAYGLGATSADGTHRALSTRFKKLPAYKKLRGEVAKTIKKVFGESK
jgi:tetratricopeptide (TPR) repeat protein